MRFREAFHANFALAVAAIAGGLLGAGLLANHHPMAGTILTLTGASWFAGWLATLPRTPSLVRFWLLILLCGGTLGFLIQQWDNEQNYQLSRQAEKPTERPVSAGSWPTQIDRPSPSPQSGRLARGAIQDTLGHLGRQITEILHVNINR